MTRFRRLFPLWIILAGATGLGAQQFWQNQVYTEWTLKNCDKMLSDSPWALTFQNRKEARDAAGHKDFRDFRYVVQIRSAIPIRQALIRRMQINDQYDKMNSDQRKTFDAQAKAFLAISYADRLVFDVQAIVAKTVTDNQRPFWPSETVESLKDSVYLIGPGNEKIPLTGYSFKKTKSYRTGDPVEFEFTFPKQIDGHPLTGRNTGRIKLEFRDFAGWNLVEFNVSKMMQGAEIIY
jgi:hypothetical protein